MLEFDVIEKVKPNETIFNLIKSFNYQITNGDIKVLQNTNLKFTKPTTYIIKSPINLTILEYQVNEISNKNFFIEEYHEKYSFKETVDLLMKISKKD